ncbi:MAG: hypothetical protein ABH826_00300 [Patescibacteria group bacterium]
MSYVAKMLPASLFSGFLLLAAGVMPASAQVDLGSEIDLGDVGGAAGFDTNTDLADTIGSLIRIGLGLLGVVFLVLTLYAGFLWMTAGGVDDKVTKAKKILTQTIIGLILTVAAYAISGFVVESIAGSGL